MRRRRRPIAPDARSRPSCTRWTRRQEKNCGTAAARSRPSFTQSDRRPEMARCMWSHTTARCTPSASRSSIDRRDSLKRTLRNMRNLISVTSFAICCAVVLGIAGSRSWIPGEAEVGAQQAAGPALADWLTDGGDNQRTGWQRNETILTKDNVKNLKILWKIKTGNQVRALHALMPVLVIGRLNTTDGPRQVGFVNGIPDNPYAFHVE